MKNILVLFALVFFTTGAIAKDNKAVAAEISSNLEKQLSISAEQKEKVSQLIVTKLDKLQQYKNADLSDAQREEALQERRNFVSELKTILTEEQFNKWLEIRKEQLTQLRKGEKVENPVFADEIEFMRH